MPITKLIIENFKGIRDRVEIPIRPITLLFGANSAGKSTILHALLYLRELLEHQNADADRVTGGGEDIFLGGFRQLVHGHDTSRTVLIGVEFGVDADGLEPYPVSSLFRNQEELDPESYAIWTNGVSGVDSVKIEVSVSVSETSRRPEIGKYEVFINKKKFGAISGDREMRAILHDIALEHPIFAAQYSPDAIDDDSDNPITALLKTTFEGAEYIGPSSIRTDSIVLGHNVIPTWGRALAIDLDDNQDESDALHAPFAKFILSQLMVRPGELVLEHLRTYRHLGPIRSVPDLLFTAQRTPDQNRWIDGVAAWDLLYRDAEEKQELIRQVDRYLQQGDRLNLGYSLEAETTLNVPGNATAIKILERFATAPDDFDGEAALRAALNELHSAQETVQLKLTDLRRNTTVNPSDIGAGVSQVIPVLVSVLESSSKITAIEQPELHLHPAVQCALGDLFIRATHSFNERSFLVESHSEHLLLRLMRRMRETESSGSLEPELELDPSKIIILFVETYDGRSVYREMPLNERGELIVTD